MTEERDIIVQIEIWDPWDFFADHQTQGGWSYNPFNPENNVTYTADETGLPTAIDHNPRGTPSDHAFFRTVPALQNNERVLSYQRAFVDKLLSVAFDHSHVLYCMNNESGERIEWGQYWAEHVQQKAREADKAVEITDMRRSGDLQGEAHQYFHKRPGLCTFIEVSQNNADSDQAHYDDLVGARRLLKKTKIRPMNNVKIYTFNGGPDESVERFWRIVFAGGASARFHRPHPLEQPEDHLKSHGAGIGLSRRAQRNLRAMRMLTDRIRLFTMRPANGLLRRREANEAYCLAERDAQYAVYFTAAGEGEAAIDLSNASGRFTVRWLNISENEWTGRRRIEADEVVALEAPAGARDGWVALLEPLAN